MTEEELTSERPTRQLRDGVHQRGKLNDKVVELVRRERLAQLAVRG